MDYGGKSPANDYSCFLKTKQKQKNKKLDTLKPIGNMHGYCTGSGNRFSIWKYCPDQTYHLTEIKDVPVIQPYQKSWSNVYTFNKTCLQQTKAHMLIFLKSQQKPDNKNRKAYFKSSHSFLNAFMKMVAWERHVLCHILLLLLYF